MEAVKVIFNHDENDFMVTDINGTREEIAKYYMGNWFNMGVEADNMKQVTSVEFLGASK